VAKVKLKIVDTFMKKTTFRFAALIVSTAALSGCLAQPEIFDGYRVYEQVYQPAAENVEEAEITHMACWSTDKHYYIYRYVGRNPQEYRVIKPRDWANPIGGRDHPTFLAAVAVACNTTETALRNGTY